MPDTNSTQIRDLLIRVFNATTTPLELLATRIKAREYTKTHMRAGRSSLVIEVYRRGEPLQQWFIHVDYNDREKVRFPENEERYTNIN